MYRHVGTRTQKRIYRVTPRLAGRKYSVTIYCDKTCGSSIIDAKMSSRKQIVLIRKVQERGLTTVLSSTNAGGAGTDTKIQTIDGAYFLSNISISCNVPSTVPCYPPARWCISTDSYP